MSQNIFPKPYLACNGTPDLDTEIDYPIYVSAKLDGVRALAIDGIMYTRAGLPFKDCVQQRFKIILEEAKQRGVVLDGELYNHYISFQQITSACSHEDKVECLRLYVFDCVSLVEWFGLSGTTYNLRRDAYLNICQEIDPRCRYIVPVEHCICNTKDEVITIHNQMLESGYEGTMLRPPNGLYKHNRSTAKEKDLRKFKPFETIDCVIVGFKQKARLTEEAKATITDKDKFGRSKRGHRKGDREFVEELGAIGELYEVEGTAKQCFAGFTKNSSVRTEITWENREEYVGRHVEVEYQSVGMLDVLRLPRIVRFRPDLDDEQTTQRAMEIYAHEETLKSEPNNA